jgi:hypothetical protein
MSSHISIRLVVLMLTLAAVWAIVAAPPHWF